MDTVFFSDLVRNDIVDIPAGSFSGQTSMVTLKLSENKVSQLPAGLLSPLTSLKDL